MKRFAAVIAAALALSPVASEAAQQCQLLKTVSATDISGGAFSTERFTATVDQKDPSKTPAPRQWDFLKVGVDLVDASDGVTDIALSFQGAESYGGPFRDVPLCADAAPTLTCGAASAGWDPTETGNGKNWWIKPVDFGYPYGIITVTPTGHGAGDTVALEIYGCDSD